MRNERKDFDDGVVICELKKKKDMVPVHVDVTTWYETASAETARAQEIRSPCEIRGMPSMVSGWNRSQNLGLI